MSVPFEPAVPPASPSPLDTPPSDPDRRPGQEPPPDPEPDEGAAGAAPAQRRPRIVPHGSAMPRRSPADMGGTALNDDSWRINLRLKLEDFVDTFIVCGAKQIDVYDAIVTEISTFRAACARDPDPADHATTSAIEEPSNDWPAAQE